MINHVALLRFKSDIDDADVAELEKQLDDLPNRIVEIQTYEFGRDLARTDTSYDFAIVGMFANLEAIERYRGDPNYLAVSKKMDRLAEKIITADFMISSHKGLPEFERDPFDELRFKI